MIKVALLDKTTYWGNAGSCADGYEWPMHMVIAARWRMGISGKPNNQRCTCFQRLEIPGAKTLQKSRQQPVDRRSRTSGPTSKILAVIKHTCLGLRIIVLYSTMAARISISCCFALMDSWELL